MAQLSNLGAGQFIAAFILRVASMALEPFPFHMVPGGLGIEFTP